MEVSYFYYQISILMMTKEHKIFNDLAKRYENRNGGYTQILKLSERRGDDALMVVLKLVEEAK